MAARPTVTPCRTRSRRREVILDTLRKAKIDPATISYVEAHGTGTVLGDPIEITGLQRAFTEASDQGKDRPMAGGSPRQSCAVGSVKSNIGHCESAAGIAGMTKVLLQLKYRKLVPSLHTEKLNPNIKFEDTFFRVQRRFEDWEPLPVGGQTLPRRAGVSSFGAGGANAHLIIEQYLEESVSCDGAQLAGEAGAESCCPPKNTDRLRESANSLAAIPREKQVGPGRVPNQPSSKPRTGGSMWDVAYTLQVGREPFEERVAVQVSSASQCVTKLRAWIEVGETAGLYHGNSKKSLPGLEGERETGLPAETVDALLREEKLDRVAERWIAGSPVNWSILYGALPVRRISLPTYPFVRRRYWVPKSSFFDLKAPQREGNGQAASAGNGGTASDHRGDGEEQGLQTRIEVPDRPVLAGATGHSENGKSALGLSIMFFTQQPDHFGEQIPAGPSREVRRRTWIRAIRTPERHFHPFGGIYSSPATLMATLATTTVDSSSGRQRGPAPRRPTACSRSVGGGGQSLGRKGGSGLRERLESKRFRAGPGRLSPLARCLAGAYPGSPTALAGEIGRASER